LNPATTLKLEKNERKKQKKKYYPTIKETRSSSILIFKGILLKNIYLYATVDKFDFCLIPLFHFLPQQI